MAQYTLGRIVPEKLVPIFDSSNPYSCQDITDIMNKVFTGFSSWDYLHYISNGLVIECKKKPTQSQLQALFNRVEQLLEHYPVLDHSDTISYEDYVAKIESMPNDWLYGEGYYFTKLHQRHNERAFAELIRKNREEVTE